MRRIGLFSIFACGIFASACETPSPVGVPDEGSLVPAGHGAVHARPFTGRSSGITSVALPPPGEFVVTAHGSGEMVTSHMGKGSYAIEAMVLGWPDPSIGLTCVQIVGGDLTLTAANGDEVAGEIQGELCSGDLIHYEVELSTVVTGGTGRFDGATGFFTTRCTGVVVDPASFAFDMRSRSSGWIAY